MRILVCGGRNYRNREAAFAALDRAHAKRPITVLIHGACHIKPSADWLGEEWAVQRDIPVIRCPVDRRLDGPWPGAGPRRNRRMRDTHLPEGVLALPGGEGTQRMCDIAAEWRLPIWRPYG